MTLTRTMLAAGSDHNGITRAVELDLAVKGTFYEGVLFDMVGGVPRITVTSAAAPSFFGTPASVSLDLSRAELQQIAAVATALADRLGEGPF